MKATCSHLALVADPEIRKTVGPTRPTISQIEPTACSQSTGEFTALAVLSRTPDLQSWDHNGLLELLKES